MTATATSLASSPWLQIWIRPRSTVRQLLNAPSGPALWVLPISSGIGQSLIQGASNNVGAKGPVVFILLLSTVIGAIWGLLQIHFLSLLFYGVGRVTQRPATFRQVRLVLAWAEVPHVVLVASWVLAALVFGRVLFLDPDALGTNPPPLLLLGMLFVYLVSFICVAWSLVLVVKGLAEAQGTSVWWALGSVVVVAALIGVATIVILAFVVMLAR